MKASLAVRNIGALPNCSLLLTSVQLSQYIRFAHSTFWFGLVLGFAFQLRLWLTFQCLQASPSVPVFQSSVPSDFASLENLSRLNSVPSFRLLGSLASVPSAKLSSTLTCVVRLRLT